MHITYVVIPLTSASKIAFQFSRAVDFRPTLSSTLSHCIYCLRLVALRSPEAVYPLYRVSGIPLYRLPLLPNVLEAIYTLILHALVWLCRLRRVSCLQYLPVPFSGCGVCGVRMLEPLRTRAQEKLAVGLIRPSISLVKLLSLLTPVQLPISSSS
jgi:hypothetical protein